MIFGKMIAVHVMEKNCPTLPWEAVALTKIANTCLLLGTKNTFRQIGYCICRTECHRFKDTLLLIALKQKILCRHVINYIMCTAVCSSFMDVFFLRNHVRGLGLFTFHYSKHTQNTQSYTCKYIYLHCVYNILW